MNNEAAEILGKAAVAVVAILVVISIFLFFALHPYIGVPAIALIAIFTLLVILGTGRPPASPLIDENSIEEVINKNLVLNRRKSPSDQALRPFKKEVKKLLLNLRSRMPSNGRVGGGHPDPSITVTIGADYDPDTDTIMWNYCIGKIPKGKFGFRCWAPVELTRQSNCEDLANDIVSTVAVWFTP